MHNFDSHLKSSAVSDLLLNCDRYYLSTTCNAFIITLKGKKLWGVHSIWDHWSGFFTFWDLLLDIWYSYYIACDLWDPSGGSCHVLYSRLGQMRTTDRSFDSSHLELVIFFFFLPKNFWFFSVVVVVTRSMLGVSDSYTICWAGHSFTGKRLSGFVVVVLSLSF